MSDKPVSECEFDPDHLYHDHRERDELRAEIERLTNENRGLTETIEEWQEIHGTFVANSEVERSDMTDKSGWALIANPAWEGKEPAHLERSDCHDHSHFVTVQCECGEHMHMHETQWQQAGGQGIASRCHACGKFLTFPPGYFDNSLAEMRRQGWIK